MSSIVNILGYLFIFTAFSMIGCMEPGSVRKEIQNCPLNFENNDFTDKKFDLICEHVDEKRIPRALELLKRTDPAVQFYFNGLHKLKGDGLTRKGIGHLVVYDSDLAPKSYPNLTDNPILYTCSFMWYPRLSSQNYNIAVVDPKICLMDGRKFLTLSLQLLEKQKEIAEPGKLPMIFYHTLKLIYFTILATFFMAITVVIIFF